MTSSLLQLRHLVVALAAAARVGAHAIGRALFLPGARVARLRLGQALAVRMKVALVTQTHTAAGRVALGVLHALAQTAASLLGFDLNNNNN